MAIHPHNAAMHHSTRLGRLLVAALLMVGSVEASHAGDVVKVGSKRFTESYVLAEIAAQTLQRAGIAAEHRQGLGNTAILEQALTSGQVDVYPEYTGTIVRELLKRNPRADAPPPTLAELNEWLSPRGLRVAVPLGFNNTYAIAMREADAARLGIASLSGLARLPADQLARLRTGLSHEFLVRADGWPALKRHYALPLQEGPALDHGLAYQALAQGQVDLIDVYSTDAQIGRLKLRVLQDDRAFFPRYDAVLLMRSSLPAGALAALAALQGHIDEPRMIDLNAAAELDGKTFTEVARAFVEGEPKSAPGRSGDRTSLWALVLAPDLGRLLLQHLGLVLGSVLLAVAVGVPLGVAAHRFPRLGAALLAATGLLQTVPSLAMLAFLIALLGTIGFAPALLALFLYALLPIVRNTLAGLAGVPAGLSDAARALGLRDGQVLRLVQLPLALPTVLAGVSTAAVINVGTATVAAFVGAGGLGERIVAGLAVNDIDRMLAGAIPAAVLALVVQGMFAVLERWTLPAPARTGTGRASRMPANLR